MHQQNKYMLDTNVFNHVLDGSLTPAEFADHAMFVTGIQADELKATNDPARREALFAVFEQVPSTSLLASSFVFGVEGAGFGQAYWNDGSGRFEKMLSRLQVLDKRKDRDKNQMRDTLIAETALKNDAVLITADANLSAVMVEFGGRAISLEEFHRDASEHRVYCCRHILGILEFGSSD